MQKKESGASTLGLVAVFVAVAIIIGAGLSVYIRYYKSATKTQESPPYSNFTQKDNKTPNSSH
jgi:hypothetical protein